MNRRAEAINHFLAWLIQDQDLTNETPSGEGFNPVMEVEDSGAAQLQFNSSDPLDSEEMQTLPSDLGESNQFSFQEMPLFQTGVQPAVQDRFHSLLKRRLRTEIERRPPLFPWETEVCEYESEVSDWTTPDRLPAPLWGVHLRQLNVPVPMPDAVLSQLLNQCQVLVQSSLQEGIKLVRAVESLFPGQGHNLNQMAGMVLAAPARSGERSLQSTAGFPTSYEAATEPQRMVLSLLAAQEIMQSLMLTVSPNQPRAERQWATASGALRLSAEYPLATGQLRIEGQLPCSGSLRLKGQTAQATAQRSSAGFLSVELFDLSPNHVYPLEIHLADVEQPPLIFAIHPKTQE